MSKPTDNTPFINQLLNVENLSTFVHKILVVFFLD